MMDRDEKASMWGFIIMVCILGALAFMFVMALRQTAERDEIETKACAERGGVWLPRELRCVAGPPR